MIEDYKQNRTCLMRITAAFDNNSMFLDYICLRWWLQLAIGLQSVNDGTWFKNIGQKCISVGCNAKASGENILQPQSTMFEKKSNYNCGIIPTFSIILNQIVYYCEQKVMPILKS